MMSKGTLCTGILVGLLLTSACSTPGPGEQGRDFELFFEDGELDEIEFEEQDPPPGEVAEKETGKVERERLGVRFAWGGEAARGFFQVFTEDWGGSGSSSLTTYGIGGGVKGSPVASELSQDVVLIIPYRGDISIAGGSDTVGTTDRALAYAELHLEVGVGIDWMGFRPSIGLALSSLGGAYTEDYTVGSENEYTMAGTNLGYFLDLFYKYADFPLYGHLRFQGGDYSVTTLGIGGKF